MKKTFLLLLILVVSCGVLLSQYGRVGYLDSEIIMKSYHGYDDLKKNIEEETKQWSQQEKALIDESKALQEEYQKQKMMLTDEKRIEKEEEIMQKEYELRNFQEQIWGTNGEFQNKQQEVLAPTYKTINDIIANISENEGFDMVIDVIGGMIVYANPELNITELVIEELNKQYDEANKE